MLSLIRKLLDKKNSNSTVYPAGADGPTVAGAVGAWAWSAAYVQIVAATPAATDMQLVAVVVEAVSGADRFEVQIGIGGAGAETPIATFRFTATAAELSGRYVLPSSIPIPGGSRISARTRSSGGGASADLAVECIAL